MLTRFESLSVLDRLIYHWFLKKERGEMGYIRKGVLGYVVLSLFLINQVSAKQVKPKKLKARATTTATRTRSTATTTTPATAPQIPPTEVKKNSASPVTEPYKKVSSAPLS
jgi:hypothetical protein